ncbi:MAG: aspartate kinase [Hansschlegelia sp.]
MNQTIVKFGGSLLGASGLDALLAVAARHGAIVVPGGGPFADTVRAAQQALGFGDEAAHQAAILAMEQTATVLAERAPGFALCATPGQFSALAGRPAIWRPAAMASAAALPASWDVTSDSLAVWLAIAIGAPRVALLKSASVAAGGSPERWAADGLVDAYLPTIARGYDREIACLGPADPDTLDAYLGAKSLCAKSRQAA